MNESVIHTRKGPPTHTATRELSSPQAAVLARGPARLIAAGEGWELWLYGIKNVYFQSKAFERTLYLLPPQGALLPGLMKGHILLATNVIYGFAVIIHYWDYYVPIM